MSEQGLTREQVVDITEENPVYNDKLALLRQNDAALRALLAQQRDELERLSYCLQVHGDVLGETVHKHEQQVAALKTELEQVKQTNKRLRAVCEDATEEVIEYAGVSTPGGKPAEPSLSESIRQMKEDYGRKIYTLKAELEQVKQERDKTNDLVRRHDHSIHIMQKAANDLIADTSRQLADSQARCAQLEKALKTSDEGLKAWLHMYAPLEVEARDWQQCHNMISDKGGTLAYLAGLFKMNRQALTPTERM
jgi:DNA repair exonuclease SbcCD ATPase subunit